MLQLRACLSARSFRLVAPARSPYLRAALHTRRAVLNQHTPSHILSSDDDQHMVTPLEQPRPLRDQAQSDAAAAAAAAATTTTFKLYNRTGYKLRTIQRSYPNGKPENLLNGLEQLVSSYHHDEQGSVTRNKTSWKLTKHGNAIVLFHFVKDIGAVDKLTDGLESISQAANHHPHHVCYFGTGLRPIFGILCTTHIPRGLSLKDVKVAQEINQLVEKLNDEDPQAVKLYNRGLTPVILELERMMYAESSIASRDAAAEAMRKKGREVDEEELDRQFKITKRLRATVIAWRDTMSKLYMDAKSGKHNLSTPAALQSTPASEPRITRNTPGDERPAVPKAHNSVPDMYGSTALPVNMTPSVATTAVRHQSLSHHRRQSPRIGRVAKKRESLEPDARPHSLPPSISEDIEADSEADATSKTKSKVRIRYHLRKRPAEDVPVKIRRISVS